jgi:hypothetical protein
MSKDEGSADQIEVSGSGAAAAHGGAAAGAGGVAVGGDVHGGVHVTNITHQGAGIQDVEQQIET